MRDQRQDAISAFRVLNYFVGDLVAASQVRDLFLSEKISATVPPRAANCVHRMCLSYLFLTLDKWSEFYRRFNSIIPSDCKPACSQLRRQIERRGIRKFRNTFVGHVWDKDLDRPLTEQEVQAAADRITDGDEAAFAAWCNDHSRNHFPATVVAIVEHTRDRIREEFGLRHDEIFTKERAA